MQFTYENKVKIMKKIKDKKINDLKVNKLFSNLNDYLVRIDYFDKNGVKKAKNNIPIKFLLNKKSSTI
jgi:hypothetical protein